MEQNQVIPENKPVEQTEMKQNTSVSEEQAVANQTNQNYQTAMPSQAGMPNQSPLGAPVAPAPVSPKEKNPFFLNLSDFMIGYFSEGPEALFKVPVTSTLRIIFLCVNLISCLVTSLLINSTYGQLGVGLLFFLLTQGVLFGFSALVQTKGYNPHRFEFMHTLDIFIVSGMHHVALMLLACFFSFAGSLITYILADRIILISLCLQAVHIAFAGKVQFKLPSKFLYFMTILVVFICMFLQVII